MHSWRVPPGLAAVDVIATAGAAFFLTAALRPRAAAARSCAAFAVAYALVLIALVCVGAAAHRAFCVDTALNCWLGIAAEKCRPPKSAGRRR